MAIRVSPGLATSTHHVKLTSGATEVGLVLCDGRGNATPLAVDWRPYPRTAIRIQAASGSKYDNADPLFASIAQLDFSGGRGADVFEDDRTKYLDGYCLDATRPGRVVLGGQETYATGDWRKQDQVMPGSVVWPPLIGANRYMARSFVASASYTATTLWMWIRAVGVPGTLTVTLRANNAGVPGTVLATPCVLTAPAVTGEPSSFKYFTFSQALTAGTTYWLVADGGVGGDAGNYWAVGSGSANCQVSADGSTWSLGSGAPYFRLVDGTTPFTARFFEYKGQLYFATQDDKGAAGRVYMNGWRGACDDNIADLSRMNDATQTGWASGYDGQVVRLLTSNERQNWRATPWGASGYAHVTPSWEQAVTVVDDYVVLGSNKFSLVPGSSILGAPVTDVAVGGGKVFLAQGYNREAVMHREFNSSGTWYADGTGDTLCWRGAGVKARRLKAMRDVDGGQVLWMTTWRRGEEQLLMDAIPEAWGGKLLAATTLVAAGAAWTEATYTNVTASLVNGLQSRYVVADAFTSGLIASKAIESFDVRYFDRVVMTVMPSIDIGAGVLQLVLSTAAQCSQVIVSVDFPAMRAGSWNTVYLPLGDLTGVNGAGAVISVGLRTTADVGAVTFDLLDDARMYKDLDYIRLDDYGNRVTGLETYGEPETAWVFTEGVFGEIRYGKWLPYPLREMQTLRDENNGRASTVNDVYLYFSFGSRGGLQRFYDRNLDNLGLDKGAGLPAVRQGPIVSLLSYPDRVFAAVDAGPSGESAVFALAMTGWHEVYRAPIGERIRSLYLQVIPGAASDRLWVSQGADVVWLPVAVNPENDTAYRFRHEAWFTTGRIHGGSQDVTKFFNTLKIAALNLTAGQKIVVDYRLDGGAWARIGTFSTSPFQQVDFSVDDSVTGKAIELRYRLETTDNTKTPVLLGSIIDTLELQTTRETVTLTFRLADDDHDLTGEQEAADAITKLGIITGMVNAGQPVLVNSVMDLLNGKRMFLQPVAIKPEKIIMADGKEGYVCQMSLIGYE